MRDNHYYQDGGHLSVEAYCESELTKHGGYRRVRDLLSAKKVVDTLPEELRVKITKLSQTRPLLRLVKTPDKLQEVVAIAAKEKPFPTAADFAKAVQEVAPTVKHSTKSENPRVEETAHAPLGGASPSRTESASELEELPVAMDCTSLTLVDDVQDESALLIGENQECGVEAIFLHEGTCFAAPVAQNEKSLNSAIPAAGVAIANQPQGQVEQSNTASLRDAARTLLAENQECGVEAAVSHEGTYPAAPVSLNQSEIFEWLDRANLGECLPLWVIQYLLDSKYYASMRATISKFEKQWNLSVVNRLVRKFKKQSVSGLEMVSVKARVNVIMRARDSY